MGKGIYLWLILWGFAGAVKAQSTDTLVRAYLVCESQKNCKRTKVIREGKTLFVRDNAGRISKGQLKVKNDSIFTLYNKSMDKTFTCNVHTIDRIRKPNVLRSIGCGIIIVYGVGQLIGSISFLANPQPSFFGLRNDYLFSTIGLAVGGLFEYVGFKSISGKMYHHSKFKYRLVKTKGHKLTRKNYKTLH